MPTRIRERRPKSSAQLPTGLAIDASGGAVVDPTANVIALTDAANKRQDDLREETNKRIDAELKCVRDIANIRALHQDEISTIRTEYMEKLRDAEAKRIDAIRHVDREDVAKTATSAQTAVATLATAASTTAETLRTQAANLAAAAEARLSALTNEVNKRLSALELALSEGKGKQTIFDPQMEKMSATLEMLARNQEALARTLAEGSGKAVGSSAMLGTIIAVGGVLVGVASVAFYFIGSS